MSKGAPPRLLDSVVPGPPEAVGFIWYRVPGFVAPVTNTLPIAHNTPCASVAPVHVSISFPSLARTLETVPLSLFATHRSAPSDWTDNGLLPTTVNAKFREVCVVQY